MGVYWDGGSGDKWEGVLLRYSSNSTVCRFLSDTYRAISFRFNLQDQHQYFCPLQSPLHSESFQYSPLIPSIYTFSRHPLKFMITFRMIHNPILQDHLLSVLLPNFVLSIHSLKIYSTYENGNRHSPSLG